VCLSAENTNSKIHMTESKNTANSIDTAQRLLAAKLRQKTWSNIVFCPQLPCKSEGHMFLPDIRTSHAIVTMEPLTYRTEQNRTEQIMECKVY
jgi:hypothetical protein